jgi:hypothetical protein
LRLNLRHFGANDDPNYEQRDGIKNRKAAERSRRYRAKHSTGGKRGRPVLQLSPDEASARRRAQKAECERRRRVELKSVTPLNKIDSVTELKSTQALSGSKKTGSTEYMHCGEPAASIGRPLFPIDGDRAVNFARLRLVAIAENAAEDAFPERWSDAIFAATTEWTQAKRAVAAGMTPIIAPTILHFAGQ